MENKKPNLFEIIFTFFKIGLFTFGGGYSMISLIMKECVEKKKWLTELEFLDIMSIAEITPGPVAINTATYVGYKQRKVLGGILATLGVCLPSLIIIILISIFYNKLISFDIINYALKGILSAVSILILFSAIKLFKTNNKASNVYVSIIFIVITLLLNIFVPNLSTILIILSGGIFGLIIYSFILGGKTK